MNSCQRNTQGRLHDELMNSRLMNSRPWRTLSWNLLQQWWSSGVAEASWRRACCKISSPRLVAIWVLLLLLLPFLFFFPSSSLSHGLLAVTPWP